MRHKQTEFAAALSHNIGVTMARAAVEVDYDRLEELRNDRETYTLEEYKGLDWSADCPDDAIELAELEADAGDCEDADGTEHK